MSCLILFFASICWIRLFCDWLSRLYHHIIYIWYSFVSDLFLLWHCGSLWRCFVLQSEEFQFVFLILLFNFQFYFQFLTIFTKPSARAGYDTRSIFKRSLTGFNSEFSFSKTSCLTKTEEPSLPYYLPIAGGRIIGFIHFPRVLVLCEMQSVSSRIWTRVAVSISCDDNHYTIQFLTVLHWFITQVLGWEKVIIIYIL